MEYVLLVFNMNWLDEFDLFGLRIHTQDYWEKLESAIKSADDFMVDYYFGTNQGLDDITFKDLLDEIKVIPIDQTRKETFEVLNFHPERGIGQFPMFEDMFHDMNLDYPDEITPEIKAIIESTDD